MRNINFCILSLFFLLGFNNIVSSQVVADYSDFSIFLGDVQKSNASIESLAKTESGDLLCVQNKGTFFRSFSRNKSRYSFDLLHNYTLPKYNPIKFYGDGKKSKLFNYTFIGNSILGISSQTSFFNRSPDLFYHVINLKTEESNNHGYSLSDLNLKYQFIDLSRISMVASEDSKYAAAVYIPETRQNEYSNIKYIVFSKDSTPPLEREFLFPYPSENFEPLDFFILNHKEQLFFAGHYPDKGPNNRQKDLKQVYQKISIDKIGEEGMISNAIEMAGSYFTDIKVIEEENGVILSALYLTTLDGFKVEGLLIAKINNDGEVVNETFTPISLDNLNLLQKKDEEYFPSPKNSDLEYSKFNILDFKKIGDDFLCIAELNAVEYRFGGADLPGRTSTIDTYYWSGELLVIKVNSMGELIWASVIPKIQRTINDGGYYLSSSVYIGANKVHFFFNDNLLNYNDERHYIKYGVLPSMAQFNPSKNTIAHASIQLDDGKMFRESTVGRLETNIVFIPKLSVPFEKQNKLFIYGQNGNKHRFGSINFNP